MKQTTEKKQYPGKLTAADVRATVENIPVHCRFDKLINTADLKPHPRNPNEHPDKQINMLAHIIRTQGWRAPITVSTQSGYITRGHGRLAAANKLNLKTIPVEFQNYESPEAEWADLIADNKIAELADMSNKKTAGLIEELNAANFDLTLTGVEADDLLAILNDTKKIKEETIIKTDIKTKPGDLYQIGPHKLLCGDATSPADITRLMGDERAQLIYTDPPYGVEYESEKYGKILNDKLKDNTLINLLLIPAFKNCFKFSKDDAAVIIWYAAIATMDFFYSAKAAGFDIKQVLIWIKQNFVLGRSDYQYNYEPCIYAQKIGHKAKINGDRTQVTTFELSPGGYPGAAIAIADGLKISAGATNSEIFIKADGPKGKKLRVFRIERGESLTVFTSDSETDTWRVKYDNQKDLIHPTQKPVELAVRPIKNHTNPGDIVLDVFAGSGSVLIAADRLERRTRLIELSPANCDNIINRYANHMAQQNKTIEIVLIKPNGNKSTVEVKTSHSPEIKTIQTDNKAKAKKQNTAVKHGKQVNHNAI